MRRISWFGPGTPCSVLNAYLTVRERAAIRTPWTRIVWTLRPSASSDVADVTTANSRISRPSQRSVSSLQQNSICGEIYFYRKKESPLSTETGFPTRETDNTINFNTGINEGRNFLLNSAIGSIFCSIFFQPKNRITHAIKTLNE
jgi:hypothetical protein